MVIEDIITKGEDIHSEFKTSFNIEAIESLVAFANTNGGAVYIGISDSGEVKGVNLSKETIVNWINDIKQKTSPQLVPDAEIIEWEQKRIVKLSIAEYPVKPIALKGRCYKRVANSNHLLSINEVVNMHLKTVNSSWDFYIRPDKTIDDISIKKVQKALELIAHRTQNDDIEKPLTFLKKYELIRNSEITNACYLMFCKDDYMVTTFDTSQ